MQTIVAKFKIVPGKEAEAEEAMKKMAGSVESNESAALAYIFHRNLKDPAEVTVFEVYRDDAASAAHVGSEHMGAFRTHFGSLFDPTTVKIDRMERIAGFNRGG
jgi:quinol monooxygenase YgiN